MIRDQSGLPFFLTGRLGLYDPQNPDNEVQDSWDRESIEIGGSPILYYRLLTKNAKIDPLYNEIRDKIWSEEPFKICALFTPARPLQPLDQFGIDNPVDVIFTFNRTAFLDAVRELPTSGSLIFSVVDRTWWEVIQSNINITEDLDRMLWSRHRLQAYARSYQPTATEHDPARMGFVTNKTDLPIR